MRNSGCRMRRMRGSGCRMRRMRGSGCSGFRMRYEDDAKTKPQPEEVEDLVQHRLRLERRSEGDVILQFLDVFL